METTIFKIFVCNLLTLKYTSYKHKDHRNGSVCRDGISVKPNVTVPHAVTTYSSREIQLSSTVHRAWEIMWLRSAQIPVNLTFSNANWNNSHLDDSQKPLYRSKNIYHFNFSSKILYFNITLKHLFFGFYIFFSRAALSYYMLRFLPFLEKITNRTH